MTNTTNRHPVDELADLRAEIASLEGRADYLRRMILAERVTLTGDENVATVRETCRTGYDTKAMLAQMGEGALAPFRTETRIRQVLVRPKPRGASAPADLPSPDEEF